MKKESASILKESHRETNYRFVIRFWLLSTDKKDTLYVESAVKCSTPPLFLTITFSLNIS